MGRTLRRVFGTTLALITIAGHGDAQSILTVAGGVVGDGRPATRASLLLPTDVELDGANNLYIADQEQHRVRRVDGRTGIITTVAGNGLSAFAGVGGPATEASFKWPMGIAVDSAANLYIASEDNRVLRVDARTGILTLVAGTGDRGFSGDDGPATEARLAGPSGVAVDAEGNVYIADRLNDRIRRVDASTGIITTIAGTGTKGFSGDGGPAGEARLNLSGDGYGTNASDVTIDADGNLLIADTFNLRVRRVDAASGIITTVAGGGNGGDGGPATGARLSWVTDVSVGLDGSLFLAEPNDSRIRRVDGATGTISTVAGGSDSGFGGDGGPAIDAVFDQANASAIDSNGNLYISDEQNNRIRKVDAASAIVDTIVGGYAGDGLVATEASFNSPDAVVVGADGALYVSDTTAHRVRRIDPESKIIETVAGTGRPGFSGDGGPATEAAVSFPGPVAIDSTGSLYIGDLENVRVRKVDPNGIMTTAVGNGEYGDGGDGGPASAAELTFAFGLAVDASNNLYIALPDDNKIRRVDAATGIITTVAGTGAEGFSGDGGPATAARLAFPADVSVDAMGNIYIADLGNDRIRRVDAASGVIETILEMEVGYLSTDSFGSLFLNAGVQILRMNLASGVVETMAGSGRFGYGGDGGPALDADLVPTGIDVDDDGNLWIGDRGRVRAVFRCTDVMAPGLLAPTDGAFLSSNAPALRWSAVEGAFSYDLYLDTSSSAAALLAEDVTSTRFTLSNLEPETTYYWRVVAKGDPFCEPPSRRASRTMSFRTPAACLPPPAASPSQPLSGASVTGPAVTLAWDGTPGAARYDVFLGTSTPPPFLASTRSTSLDLGDLVPGQTYFWSVVTRASCNAALLTSSATSSFTVAGACQPAGDVELIAPTDGLNGAPVSLDVAWAATPGASSYDLFLGTDPSPPLLLHVGSRTSARVSGLAPATTYYWRVRANVDCDPSLSRLSPLTSFVTSDQCPTPAQVRFLSNRASSAGAGRTYLMEWNRSDDLGSGGSYLVERSRSSTFDTILDAQQTAETSASFVADTAGALYHRVRPISGCDPAIETAYSPTAIVNVVSEERPNVVFSVEPEALVIPVGKRLEDLAGSFVLENIGSEPVEVSVSSSRIDSVPFFTIRDPLGSDTDALMLEPRVPKELEIRFSGPPNDVAASYQGLVVVTTKASPVATYAYVNLKIGDQAGAVPEIRFEGTPTAFAFFPGFAGDDANRPPMTIEVHNPGATPMELSTEIGPQLWLEPESGWNETPIPPGATRSLQLFTRRKLAPNGSALPRYTFLTLRTRTGDAARLLVQDNDDLQTSAGRPSALTAQSRTIIVPEVVSGDGTDPIVSKISLTNLSTTDVQVELIFTPAGADGYGPDSIRASVIVPANDVVLITDPLRQVFDLDSPVRGTVEVEAASSSIDRLRVQSAMVRASDVQRSLVDLPVLLRSSGARAGARHRLVGLTATDGSSTEIALVETTGLDDVEIRARLYDSSGALVTERDVSVPRYGFVEVPDLVPAEFTAGWADLEVLGGGGSAVGLARIVDMNSGAGGMVASQPVEPELQPARRELHRFAPSAEVTRTLVAPYVAKGKVGSSDQEWRTVMGFVSPPGGVELLVTFTDEGGNVLDRSVTIPASSLAGAVVEIGDVLGQLFGVTGSAAGSITVTGSSAADVYGRLVSSNQMAGTIELVSTISESVSSLSSRRPLYVEGLEQSTDPARGTRWSLHVREVEGNSGMVRVRLYEAGNRATPIAEKAFGIEAGGQLSLETVFEELDLDTSERRKDRTNVLLVVTADAGGAGIVATALEIDNETGSPTPHVLRPLSGGLGGGSSLVTATPIIPETSDQGNRRRPVVRPD